MCDHIAYCERNELKAELANARLERDDIGSLNSSLIAELAEARRALLAGNDTVLANKKLQEDNATQAARIAELAEANDHLHNLCAEKHARAERAEAQLKTAVVEGNNLSHNLREAEAKLAATEAELAEAKEHAHYATGVADLAMKHRNSAEAERDAMRDGNRPLPYDRDHLGRLVREAWVRWAYTQPNPKPSWLVDYVELSEPDKEADRQIGVSVARWTIIGDAARAAVAPSPAGPDGKSLAVLYCMDHAEEDVKLLREALEGMIAVAEGRFDGNPHADIDAIAKARVALAPSPAGREG